MQQIMVTGVNGFVGHHLAKELVAQGWEVIGVGYDPETTEDLKNLLNRYITCDLTDPEQVKNLPLGDVKAIISLAGLAAVGNSFDQPELYMKVNVSVLTTLGDYIKELGRKDLRIIAVSTGALYDPSQPLPLTEASVVTGTSSPYAASKLAMEKAALALKAEGLDCMIVRPFNHIGPGQLEGFLLPDLYAKIQAASGATIKVGNLETQRDYTDVRDVARAYIALIGKEKLQYSIYNVCSGEPVAGTTILEELKKVCGRTDLKTEVDKQLFRPSDSQVIYGDNSRLKTETSWQPTIPLAQTIKDFVASTQSKGK